MLTRQQARDVLSQYAESRLARLAMGAKDMGGPLIFLGTEDTPFRHVGTLKDGDDARSAYHVAHAMHDAILNLEAQSITVCMFVYKIIQAVKYHGFILYHVDRDGFTHTRILDPTTGHQWILDRSPYWKPFPYKFGEGPADMPAVLGRHEDPPPAGGFDEWLRP